MNYKKIEQLAEPLFQEPKLPVQFVDRHFFAIDLRFGV